MFGDDLARTVTMILIAAAVFTAVQAVSGLITRASSKRKVNRRLAVAEGTASLGDLVLELRKQRGLDAEGARVIPWEWFADIVVRSGLHFQPRKWLAMATAGGLGVWLVIYILLHNPFIGIAVGIIAAIGGPLGFLMF